MMKKWKVLSSDIVFDNKWFKIQKDKVELPNKNILDDYLFWKEPNVSQIVAITKENKIVLVKQYKHGVRDFVIECPAGFVGNNEDFEAAAKRELLEETGYKGDNLEYLGKISHNPTKSSGVVKIFLAKNVTKISLQNLDQNEDVETFEVGIKRVLEMIQSGEIWASGTIASIFLALNRLKYKYELS